MLHIHDSVLVDWRERFFCRLEEANCHIMNCRIVERATCQGAVGSFWDLCWPPADEGWGPLSYTPKEMDSANNLNELGSRIFSSRTSR